MAALVVAPPNGDELGTFELDSRVPIVVGGASTHVPRLAGGGLEGAEGALGELPPHALSTAMAAEIART